MMSYLGLNVRRPARRRADFGCFADDLLLLQSHAVLARCIPVLFIVEDGIGVIHKELVLLRRGEQLSATRGKGVQANVQAKYVHITSIFNYKILLNAQPSF